MPGLRRHGGADKVAFLPVADHLRAAHAAEGAQSGQQINGLQEVGLALGVVPQQQVEAGWKIRVQPRVIAEVAKPQMKQMHNAGNLRSRPQSAKSFANESGAWNTF